ncbi:MAG: hypothetical protein AAB612_02145 [Patescibacteria group bacterium]
MMTHLKEEWHDGQYQYLHGERVTPVEKIPPEYQKRAVLPGGRHQIIDKRIAYTFHPEYRDLNFPNGALLECIDALMDEIAP